jgi:hypothetical protein
MDAATPHDDDRCALPHDPGRRLGGDREPARLGHARRTASRCGGASEGERLPRDEVGASPPASAPGSDATGEGDGANVEGRAVPPPALTRAGAPAAVFDPAAVDAAVRRRRMTPPGHDAWLNAATIATALVALLDIAPRIDRGLARDALDVCDLLLGTPGVPSVSSDPAVLLRTPVTGGAGLAVHGTVLARAARDLWHTLTADPDPALLASAALAARVGLNAYVAVADALGLDPPRTGAT